MSEKVDAFLAHYSSKYYDPAKAREYYLRTRELKGREPVLSAESRQKQSEAMAYVSKEIQTRRTADLTKLDAAAKAQAEAHTARMEKLQGEAKEFQEKIVAKLKAKLEQIEKQLKIPENASPKLRAFLQKQRQAQVKTAVGKAKEDLDGFKSGLNNAINTAREDYRKFRESNSLERKTTSENYRKDLETEKQNIKDQVR